MSSAREFTGFRGSTAYNRSDVTTFFSSRLLRAATAASGLLLALFCASAKAQTAASSASGTEADRGRILLVLPFDNRSGQPNLEWVREAAADLLSRRFASAGFAPMSRADRTYAIDHLGLPQGFQPSRARALKLAQTLDADSIIVGSFMIDGPDVVVEGRIVDVPHLRMGAAVTARGPMPKMIGVFDSLAWKLTRELKPDFNVAEETFIAASRGIRMDAYERYIRGITEQDQAERQKYLEKSVLLSPNFGSAWMALGRERYASHQYDQAAEAFAKVGRGDSEVLEANFYRGLSLMFSGNYREAERSFAEVAKILPLAEVLNNEGVAVSRQGRDGTELFMQAAAADPVSADYHFNLAVSLNRHGQQAGALNELGQCLKRRSGDNEAQVLEVAWKNASTSGADPLERIVRTFDEAAFRQAAQMMDQVEAARMAALAPAERARKLAAQADGYLDRGLLLEAERLYLDAGAADPASAEAHVGLAQVRERTGDLESARKEAREALRLRPTASAWVVLGRLDLLAGRTDDARVDVGEALKAEPSNTAARLLERQILARSGQKQ